MKPPIWIRDDVVYALHDRQLAEHGGAPGIRDSGLLESALNAPKHLFHYKQANLLHLAAAYGFALAANHPFVDGNKRTAYVCMRLFLRLNGLDIVAVKEEKIRIMLNLAAGKIDRNALATWLTKHTTSSAG